jgi:hypothetical protein
MTDVRAARGLSDLLRSGVQNKKRIRNANKGRESVTPPGPSGYKGVAYVKKLNKYRASINVPRYLYVGLFDTAAEANAARERAKARMLCAGSSPSSDC